MIDHRHTHAVIRNERKVRPHTATQTREAAKQHRRWLHLIHLGPAGLLAAAMHIPGGHTLKEVFLFHIMDFVLGAFGVFKVLAKFLGHVFGVGAAH